jgi:hypothetical protein
MILLTQCNLSNRPCKGERQTASEEPLPALGLPLTVAYGPHTRAGEGLTAGEGDGGPIHGHRSRGRRRAGGEHGRGAVDGLAALHAVSVLLRHPQQVHLSTSSPRPPLPPRRGHAPGACVRATPTIAPDPPRAVPGERTQHEDSLAFLKVVVPPRN